MQVQAASKSVRRLPSAFLGRWPPSVFQSSAHLPIPVKFAAAIV
jgi:hypothetical protein